MPCAGKENEARSTQDREVDGIRAKGDRRDYIGMQVRASHVTK